MFRCEFCRKVVAPNTPCRLVTTSKVLHRHPERQKVNKQYRIIEGRRKKIFVDDPGGTGYQIGHEARACPACYTRHEQSKTI